MRGVERLPTAVRRRKRVHPPIVARVQPRTSKGITDLLLTHFQPLLAAGLLRLTPQKRVSANTPRGVGMLRRSTTGERVLAR